MNSEILDRIPPHNADAERQTLGSVLLEPKILDDLAGILKPDDFYVESNAVIFAHLTGMSQTGRRIDVTLLLDRLRQSGDLERIDGPAYLVEVADSVAVWQHWRYYAEIVRRDSRRRQIIHVAVEMLRTAETTEPEAAIGCAEASLQAIQTGGYESEPVTMLDATVQAMTEIGEIIDRKKHIGIPIGLESFDDAIGGLFARELTILAARPSQGKTSLALQVAADIAARGRRVYFATLEMGRTELAIKRLCSVSGVPNQAVRAGKIGRDEQRRLATAANETGTPNLILHDWPEIRPYDIERGIRRCKAEVAFVDYLQIVTPPTPAGKRYEQVGAIAKALKVLAARLEIPIVACAQIGRQAMQTTKEMPPKLEHLRESGDIENHADVVLILWRPDAGIEGSGRYQGEKWDADLIVAKNRKGIRDRFRLTWDGDATTFSCYGLAPVAASREWTPDGWFE